METRKPTLGLWSRLIDGDQPWGSLQVVSDRFGVTSFRLIVYPPGLSRPQGRRLRLWRGWPTWGAALWLFSVITLNQATGPWQALAIATAAYLGAGTVARHLAGETPPQVRILAATLLSGHHDPRAHAIASEISSLAHSMADADERLARGEMTAIDYELAWWRVYRQLAPKYSSAPPAQQEKA